MSIKLAGTGVTTNKTATGFTFGYDTADYGGTFTSYTPPTAEGDLEFRLVRETNGSDSYRFYIWHKDENAWHYIALSA